jgi:RNA polymerase sigma-70 factor (ECF subfamily)
VKLFKSSYKQYSDENLMLLIIKQQDQVAFEQLYNRYARKLTGFCNRMVQSKEQAEDLVHEVFMKIINQPNAFDTELTFSTWVYKVANNLCLNSIRNHQNREKLLELNYSRAQEFTSHNNIDEHKLKIKINELFKELSEKEKAVFVLRFEHECSVKEIANIIAIPEGSVKSCLFYLLKKYSTHLHEFNQK